MVEKSYNLDSLFECIGLDRAPRAFLYFVLSIIYGAIFVWAWGHWAIIALRFVIGLVALVSTIYSAYWWLSTSHMIFHTTITGQENLKDQRCITDQDVEDQESYFKATIDIENRNIDIVLLKPNPPQEVVDYQQKVNTALQLLRDKFPAWRCNQDKKLQRQFDRIFRRIASQVYFRFVGKYQMAEKIKEIEGVIKSISKLS